MSTAQDRVAEIIEQIEALADELVNNPDITKEIRGVRSGMLAELINLSEATDSRASALRTYIHVVELEAALDFVSG